jgi:hypothetical protein
VLEIQSIVWKLCALFKNGQVNYVRKDVVKLNNFRFFYSLHENSCIRGTRLFAQ